MTFAGLGISRLYLVSSYHAGFFFHPHSTRQKVRLLEDGVVYFHPTDSAWSASRLQPQVAAVCRATDWFAEICQAARRANVEVSAWTVLLHNTRLGLLHPECAIQNAFGDPYPHALTPAHADARAYAQALVEDLAANYPLHSILLEAPNYRRRAHGGSWVSGDHHERTGVHFRELEEQLLDISFNPADVQLAEQAGIDVTSLRQAVIAHLEAAPDVPEDVPATIDEFRRQVPALVEYEAHFRRMEDSLLADLKHVAQPHGVKLIGPADPHMDIVSVGAYGEPLERIASLTRETKAKLAAHQELLVSVRLGFYSPGMGPATDPDELIVRGGRDQFITDVGV